MFAAILCSGAESSFVPLGDVIQYPMCVPLEINYRDILQAAWSYAIQISAAYMTNVGTWL